MWALLAQWYSRRTFFNGLTPFFVIISHWTTPLPFSWTIFNSRHPRMICTKFDWKWPAGSGKVDFFSIWTILQSSPLWRGPGSLFEQFWIPFTQGWFEIGQLVLYRRRCFFNINIFPVVAPPGPQRLRFETWIYIILESFHVNMSSSGSVVLLRKFFLNDPTLFL
jgi:hypothetical protein